MNYDDHNFIEITQQTKLRVEPVEPDFVERVDQLCVVERVELWCSTMSTQPKCMGSTLRTCRVELSRVVSSRAKWNLG